MFHGGAYHCRRGLAGVENKTRTVPEIAPAAAGVNEGGIAAEGTARQRCSFIVREHWRYGGAEPFCNAPSVPGSAYCARHLARCTASAESEAELAGAAEVPPPPPELGYLAEAALPELLPEDEGELRALLDVQPAAPGGEE